MWASAWQSPGSAGPSGPNLIRQTVMDRVDLEIQRVDLTGWNLIDPACSCMDPWDDPHELHWLEGVGPALYPEGVAESLGEGAISSSVRPRVSNPKRDQMIMLITPMTQNPANRKNA